MYTRSFSNDAPGDIPTGYAGSAFSKQEAIPPAEQDLSPADTEETVTPTHARPSKRGEPSLLSRLSLSRLGDVNLKSLFSSDLLLIAVALLLVTGDDDGCESEDSDLWILLLLLYFMK